MPYLLYQSNPDQNMLLRDLMVEYQECQCERLHDKVHAFRALSADGDTIAVDYSQTQEQLCAELAHLKSKKYPDHSPWEVLRRHPAAQKLRRSTRKVAMNAHSVRLRRKSIVAELEVSREDWLSNFTRLPKNQVMRRKSAGP